MGYSHHRVVLFGKKASQERLATLDNDDSLPNLICAKCKWRVESLENHIVKSLKGMRIAC